MKFVISLLFLSSLASFASCKDSVKAAVWKSEFPLAKSVDVKVISADLQVAKDRSLLFHAIVALSEEDPVAIYEVNAAGTPQTCELKSTVKI